MTFFAAISSRRGALALAALIVASPLASPASARSTALVPAPFEVGESQAGNYRAPLIAGADRDTVAAATFFREALAGDPRNAELLERAFVAALANGNMADAFRFGDRLVQREPTNGLAHLALGVRDFKAKKYAAARAHFARGGSGRARDVTATLLAAWSYAGAKELKPAIETIERLREGSFEVFREYHAGLIYALLNRPVEAQKRLKGAYDAEKNTLRLVDAYARFVAGRGEREEALRAYRAFGKALPRHPLVDEAVAALETGKPLAPLVRNADEGAAEALYGLGAAGGRQGDELAAMIYLRLSLHLAPRNGLAIVTLADIYERLKQYERAIDVYDMVPPDSPLRANADIQTGLILETLGRTADATKHLRDIVEERPKDIDALTALGNIESTRKDYAAASEYFSRAIGLVDKPDSGHWSLFYRRGISYERQKKWPLAEADFKTALDLYPDQPMVLNYLGYSWVDQNMNLDEAFKLLRRAVELRPNDGYIVDSLGWAHYRLGRFDEAVKELERAIELKPSDPVINDHLGDAYWRVGRKLEAQFQWNHARDLKPEPEDLVRILRKINDGLEDDKPAAAKNETEKNGG